MLRKITEADVAENGVQSAPDILVGEPQDVKKVFDKLVSQVVVSVFNYLVDALTADTGAGEIGTKLGKTLAAALLSDDVDEIRLNADGAIEVRRKGSEQWTATGSSGHLIIDKLGTELPQRSRMQFTNSTVEDVGGVTVVRGITGQKGDTGGQGQKGDVGPIGPKGDTGQAIIPEVDQNTGLMSFRAGAAGAVPAPVYVRGPQGPQGVQGTQGPIGPKGDIGPRGAQGQDGAQGIKGPEGPQGPRGLQGTQGEQGPSGVMGPQGPRGDSGQKGDKGDTGAPGADGERGLRGLQGVPGPQGEQGIQGIEGKQGPRGLQGLKGDRGFDGRSFEIEDVYPTLSALQAAFQTGAPGAYQVTANMELYIWSEANLAWQSIGALHGPEGPVGPEGPPGPQGEQGIQGLQGPEGELGPKGDTGDRGLKGDKGDKGDTGERGPAGDVGPKGDQGLQGQPGPQGVPGDQGIPGPKGDQGLQGPPGPPVSINGKAPDAEGKVVLGAADVGAAVPSTQVSGTMTTNGWTGSGPYIQTLAVVGIGAVQNGDIWLGQSATAPQREAARDAMLSVTGQAAGSLTITADGDKPTIDIPFIVTLLG